VWQKYVRMHDFGKDGSDGGATPSKAAAAYAPVPALLHDDEIDASALREPSRASSDDGGVQNSWAAFSAPAERTGSARLASGTGSWQHGADPDAPIVQGASVPAPAPATVDTLAVAPHSTLAAVQRNVRDAKVRANNWAKLVDA
jgi:hypothetical protein